jgi:uncharacterized protein YecT (DUF1311 family)
MMRPLCLSIVIATTALQLSACDDGTLEESAAARARDSSLAHDLQLALADSTAAARAAAGLDAKLPSSVPPMVEGTRASSSTSARVVANDGAESRTGSPIVMESPGAIAPASGTADPLPAASVRATERSAAAVDAEFYAGPSCASPALPDQRRCLLSYLARSDAPLDRTYQALITALKREADGSAQGREPATVLRLRTAQRNWLVYRDDECRRRNEGREGPLWAPTRAQCLAAFSEMRERELASALESRAAAKAATVKPAAPKSAASKPKAAKRAVAAKRTRNRRG